MEYGYSIEPVPRSERRYGFIENLAIWFGAGISIAEFWAGAILVASPLSLNLKAALLAIILGHLIGNALLSLVAVMGSDTGLPTMVLSRRPLGVKGSHLVSALNYLQLIGWTAIMIVVGARALDTVSAEVFGLHAYHAWILVLGGLVTAWAITGPERWRYLEVPSAILLLLLVAWLSYIVVKDYGFSSHFSGELSLSPAFWVGLDLVIAMPVSWAPLVADYSRFSRRSREAFWGTYIGYFASSGLFYFLGAFSNIVLGEMDPIGVIAFYGLGVPAMLIILFSTATTTFLDVYSAAITYKNMRPESDARLQVIVAGVLGTLLALVFPVEEYEWFLLLIGGAFVSLTAVMIMDYLACRSCYTEPSRVLNPGARVRWGALTVWALGFIFYILLAIGSLIGVRVPLFSALGDRLGSSIPTLILVSPAYLLYLALTGRWSSRGECCDREG